MPRSKPISHNWVLAREAEIERPVYTKQYIRGVCSEFDISFSKHGAELYRIAESAALYYRSWNLRIETAPSGGQIVSALNILSKKANELLHLIEDTDSITHSLLETEYRNLVGAAAFNRESRLWEIGAARETSDPDTHTLIAIEDLLVGLKLLTTLANNVKKRKHPTKPGRRTNLFLGTWLRTFEIFWVERLGRKFTYDKPLGGAVTEAHRFAECMLRPLDPHAVLSLPKVMEEAVRAHRKKLKK